MINVSKPITSGSSAYSECITMVRDSTLKAQLSSLDSLIRSEEKLYEINASPNQLHLTRETSTFSLSVSELEIKKVYTQRMVPKNSSGRKVYDSLILLPPNGICPFCGHRQVTTLDHYLPKGKYSHLCVLPINLVGACKDCNTDKLDNNCSSINELFFHPYFEDISNDEWLFCTILNISPIQFDFYTKKPTTWSQTNYDRLINQFKVLSLNRLYSLQSDEEARNINLSLCKLYNSGGSSSVKVWLEDNFNSRKNHRINSWQTALYRELSTNVNFYNNEFR